MDKKELGRRIRAFREQSGLTQEEVERRLELPQKSMTRMESGQRSPSTLEITKLAELLHVPLADFLNDEIATDDPIVALHRIAPGLERNSTIREEVNRCLYLCKEGICLEKILDFPTRQRPQFSLRQSPSTVLEAIKQGEIAAKEERKRLGLGNQPIYDIAELLASQGIWHAATHLPDEMSGLFFSHSSIEGMVILINASHSKVRQRFSYAHEYAHALFDTDRGILISDNAQATGFIEPRANAFAAAFLMPADGIGEILYFLNKGNASRTSFFISEAATQGITEAEDRQLAKNQKLSPQDVAYLARHFGVSYQTTVYRLHTLRYLDQQEREELLDHESQGKAYLKLLHIEQGEHTEALDTSQRELRAHISRLVIEAYRQEKISRGRVIELCKLLKIPAQELLELANRDE